ncbi:MAG: SufS family cysteine desulfurase [Candidatus Dadabacteria bacterium]|nr:MAG: SufS family cysteine desulfurase [Candidatus Dadabacteria bacterium]
MGEYEGEMLNCRHRFEEDGESKLNLGQKIRDEFPFFSGGETHYLDSAATAQKPLSVVKELSNYLLYRNANVHRGAYALSANATAAYEDARKKVSSFIGSVSERSIVFTKNATEAFNLLATSFSETFLSADDTVLLTALDHHSNIVPWQISSDRNGFKLAYAKVDAFGALDEEDMFSKISEIKPALVAFTAHSNAYGSLTPVGEIVKAAKKVGAKTVVDLSQYIVHHPVSVSEWDVDFAVFTGHKLYGPTGIGVLYGREELLADMRPYQGGGDMIYTVTEDGSTWADIPAKFEAGTPPIAEAIALAKAIDFILSISYQAIIAHEEALFEEAYEHLRSQEGVLLYGPKKVGKPQRSVISFNVEGIHPHDLATIVDEHGVQIRAGHHCAMPAMKALGLSATARASIGMYSDMDDFVALSEGIRKARRILRV